MPQCPLLRDMMKGNNDLIHKKWLCTVKEYTCMSQIAKTTKFQLYLFIKMKNKELLLLDKKVTISIYDIREKSD